MRNAPSFRAFPKLVTLPQVMAKVHQEGGFSLIGGDLLPVSLNLREGLASNFVLWESPAQAESVARMDKM